MNYHKYKLPLLILCLIGANAVAQTDWDELKASQQKILLPFESSWDGLDETTRKKLIGNTNKWLTMSPEQRMESKQKLNNFKNLTPEEQEKIKRRINRFKNLTPEERRQLNFAKKRFKNLDPEQRKKIKQRYNQLPPNKKKKAARGFVRKQRDKDFVNRFDINKRPLIREMHKNFTQPDRVELRKHMMSLPPKERHSLVLVLLEMTIDERSEYIEAL